VSRGGKRMKKPLAVLLLALNATVLAFSQAQAQSSTAAEVSLERRIELLIRSRFAVPPNVGVILGTTTKSNLDGYALQPVTFVNGHQRTDVDFLISKDGSTLARLETFSLNNNPELSIDTKGRPARGAATAKVEIINFDDLQCPFCGMLNNEILPATLEHYRGLVKVVYKDFPLAGHPWALHAAVDANCLAEQSSSAYWSYVDYVHSHGQEISGANPDLAKSSGDLDNIADTFGTKSGAVDQKQLTMCLKSQDTTEITQSLKTGSALGLSGTPQMFVDGERLPSGARPTTELWAAIDRALRAKGIEPPGSGSPGKQ
jgi:protein-disulfide isomerase